MSSTNDVAGAPVESVVHRSKPNGRFACTPVMVLDGDVPSAANIERWRDWVKRESRVDSHDTLDAIFNCALLGADKARDLVAEADKIAARKLRDMARSLAR